MGIGTSNTLTDIFIHIRSCKFVLLVQARCKDRYIMMSGQWEQVDRTITKFLNEEYQFGVSLDNIKELTGLKGEDSAKLLDCLSRNKKGM